jgi:NADH:ubiquinone oxidoreductase subunit E
MLVNTDSYHSLTEERFMEILDGYR